MIVPMKRVCLVVQESSKNDALKKLREAGVMHISVKGSQEKAASSQNVAKAAERKTKIENAMGLLAEIKVPKKKRPLNEVQKESGDMPHRRKTDSFGTEEQEPYSLDAVRSSVRATQSEYILGISKARKALEDRVSLLQREIARIESWGDFDPASVKELAALGMPVFFYELNNEAFSAIDKENAQYIIAGKSKTAVRLIVFGKELSVTGANIAPVSLPEKSISAMQREIDEIKLDIEEYDAKLKDLTSRIPCLKKEMAAALRDLEFENACVSMEKVEDIPEQMGLCYLTGYVPKEDMPHLKTVAAKNEWALSFIDPAEDDEEVPTKLKNNKFVNLLNPITDFLGIMPGYREVDISPMFLFFFCIFFGMIFGDAGYGIILCLIAVLGIIKTAKKGVPVGLQMLLLLGFFNTAWGVFTCSWFGMELQYVPQILKDISLSVFSTAKTDEAIVKQNLQIFCFSLGLIHMTIAHIKGIFRNIKTLKVLGEIGSIAMLWGMYNVVLFLVVSSDARSIPLLPAALYLLAGGFVLSFVFSSYEGSIGKSVLESCKNIISVVLGITNIFSDIMSYIRLWAVGLAGASIASTVNTMAGPLLGNFLIFAGIILLVFGHGLNLILNVLSVLVHGVRLNTLEFSSHVGLTWSGTPYKPFADKKYI